MIRKILVGAAAVGALTALFGGAASPAAADPVCDAVRAACGSDVQVGAIDNLVRAIRTVKDDVEVLVGRGPGGEGDVSVPSLGGLGPIGPIGPGPAGDILRRLPRPDVEPSVPGDGVGAKVVATYRAAERSLPNGGDVYVPSLGGLGPIGPIGPGPAGDILEEVLGG